MVVTFTKTDKAVLPLFLKLRIVIIDCLGYTHLHLPKIKNEYDSCVCIQGDGAFCFKLKLVIFFF